MKEIFRSDWRINNSIVEQIRSLQRCTQLILRDFKICAICHRKWRMCNFMTFSSPINWALFVTKNEEFSSFNLLLATIQNMPIMVQPINNLVYMQPIISTEPISVIHPHWWWKSTSRNVVWKKKPSYFIRIISTVNDIEKK